MSKKSITVKIQIGAGSANPSPPVGTALGPHGVNIMQFCNDFNAKTKDMEKGLPLPVEITINPDRTLDFILKTPPASYFLKKAAGIPKGSDAPNTNKVGKVSRKQLEEIAKSKEPDLSGANLDAMVNTIAGTARSMGIEVETEE